MSKEEELIVASRQVGSPVSKFSEQEFDAALTGIIFNISVICGCELPTHESHILSLEKEFTIFLKEFGYGNLTLEEILTAFRMNSNFQLKEKVETYGKVFNVDFASKVLSLYRQKKVELDYKLSEMFTRQKTEEVFLDEAQKRRERIIEQFEIFKNNEQVELDLTDCYMQLVEDGAFSNPKTLNNHIAEIKGTRSGDVVSIGELLAFGGVDLSASFEAERKIVRLLFSEMKKTKRLKVYNDDMKLLHPGFEIPETLNQNT